MGKYDCYLCGQMKLEGHPVCIDCYGDYYRHVDNCDGVSCEECEDEELMERENYSGMANRAEKVVKPMIEEERRRMRNYRREDLDRVLEPLLRRYNYLMAPTIESSSEESSEDYDGNLPSKIDSSLKG